MAINDSNESSAIVYESGAMAAVMADVAKIAAVDDTVLITGESGVGKDLIAKAIHRDGPRSAGKLFEINCATLPANLIESELFGHEKGAFTGADCRKPGLFEVADGGTILLDQIDSLPPELQTKLLGVLQDGSFIHLGGVERITVDSRVIATTNQYLDDMIQRKTFREDLYYRLCALVIDIPPLRDRPEDIPPLLDHYLKVHGGPDCSVKGISRKAMKVLIDYPWPGNIRELERFVRRCCVKLDDSVIDEKHLSLDMKNKAMMAGDPDQQKIKTLKEINIEYVRMVLEKAGGNKRKACGLLGISFPTLQRYLSDSPRE